VTGLLLCAGCHAAAQLPGQVFTSACPTDSLPPNRLFLLVNKLSFFRNNEWASGIVPGYTLPGVWLQPRLAYAPLENIRIEAGFHSLWYWGADRYPACAYRQLPDRDENGGTRSFHLYPWIRAQATLSSRVQIILGSLYGGASHGLSEVLYNPELNLTSDPESGLQLLVNHPFLTLDTWVDWTKFIFRSDVRQEAFIYGLSARMKVNPPESPLHVYFPVQAVAQHQGGQIDVTDLPVHTVLNGAAGAGADLHLTRSVLKRIQAQWLLAGYLQHAGNRWPLKKGYGSYALLSADLADFHLKTAYWQSDRFITILGNPLFGAPSLPLTGTFFERPKMFIAGAAWTRTFAHGFALGIDAELYHRFAARLNHPLEGITPTGAKSNYSFGIYFRATPSFLLKSF
jgi:hypothetical protein